MASSHCDGDQLRLVVAWFSRQKASSIPESLEEPLRHYLARLPAAERKRVIPTKSRKPPNDTNDHPLKSFDREALKYLKDKQDARGGKKVEDVRILRMVNALACTREPRISEKGFHGLLSNESQSPTISLASSNNSSQSLVHTPPLECTNSHLCRLFELYQHVESSAHLHALVLRILKVLIHYQFKLLKAIGIDNEAQEEEMLRRTGFTLEKSQDLRVRANGWLRFMSVLGVGALGIVQGQADDDFEKRASLPFLHDCRDFFVEKHPDMWKRMTDVDKVVGKLFLQANTEYAHDRRALLEGSETLSRCLRKAFEDPESGTLPANYERDARAERHTTSPLSALATVAVAAAADERGFPMPASHHQPHDSQVWAPSTDRSRSTNTVGPQNKDISTGQVLGSVSNEVASDPVPMYVQEMHPRWQTYPAQICSQQTSTHHIPLNGAQSLPPFDFDQGRTTMGACAVRLQDGSNPLVGGLHIGPTTDVSGAQIGHPPDPTVQTSVFQETNRTDHSVSGQALSPQWPKDAATTNAMYDHALHSNLAQFGDDTAEYDNLDWNDLFNVVYDDLGERFNRQ